MKKNNFIFAIVITQLLLLAGCKNMLTTELENFSATVDVTFSANVDKGRTVMPGKIKPEDFTSISLYGNIDGAQERLIKNWETYGDFIKDKITLEKTTWNFRLTAAYVGRECFEAETIANLSQTTSIEFEMDAAPDGLGDIDISLVLSNPEDVVTDYGYLIVSVQDIFDEKNKKLDFDYEEFQKSYFDENGNVNQELYKKSRFGEFGSEESGKTFEAIDISEKDLQSNVYFLQLWVGGLDSEKKEFELCYETIIVVTPGHISSAKIELGNVIGKEDKKSYTVFIDKDEMFYVIDGETISSEILEEVSNKFGIPLCDNFVYYDINKDLQLWDVKTKVVTSDITLYPAYKYSRINEVLRYITGEPRFTLYFYDLEPETTLEYFNPEEPERGGSYYSNHNAINEIKTTARSVKLDLSLVRMGREDIGENYKNYVITIPENFCNGCEWLEEITLPMQKDALYTSVEKDAFYGCSNLKSIYFCGGYYGDDHPLIDRNGEGCSAFGTSKRSEDGKTIYVSYYEGCTSLENIYWKGDVASYLTAFQFSNYPSMEYYCESPFVSSNAEKKNIYFWENNSWNLAKKVEVTNSRASGMYHFFGAHAFEYCTSIEQISLRDCSGQAFPTGIFANCPNLTTATISDCSVEEGTFENCTSLTDVTFLMPSMIGESAFNGCNNLSQVRIKKDILGNDCILYSNGIFTGSADDIKDFMGLENIFNYEPKCQIKKLSLEKFPHKDIKLEYDNSTGYLYTDSGFDEYRWYKENIEISEVRGAESIDVSSQLAANYGVGKWATFTLVVKDSDGNYYSQYIQLKKTETEGIKSLCYGTLFDGVFTDTQELKLKLNNSKLKSDGTVNPVIQKFTSFEEFEANDFYLDLTKYEPTGSDDYELKLYTTTEECSLICSFAPNTTDNELYFTPRYDQQEQFYLNIPSYLVNNSDKISINIKCFKGFNTSTSNNDKDYELEVIRSPSITTTIKNYIYDPSGNKSEDDNPRGEWNINMWEWNGNNENLFNSNQYLMTVTIYRSGTSVGYFQSVLYFTVGRNTITIPEINLN